MYAGLLPGGKLGRSAAEAFSEGVANVVGIEQINQRIADAITIAIPAHWSVAVFHTMFYSDGSS